MANERVWTTDDFPDPPWDKERVDAWESAATEGEKKAFDQAYLFYKAWRTSPQNSFFGETINPEVCKGKLVEAANKYQCPLGPLSYKYMRGYM